MSHGPIVAIPARVLLIEDSATQSARLRAILESSGFLVAAARDGAEALVMLAADRFDLVLSDIVMPGMDGYEVCRRIKEMAPMPVVLLTSLAEPLAIMRALEAGADSFLNKPVQADQLGDRVHKVLADWRAHGGIERRRSKSLSVSALSQTFTLTTEPEQVLSFFASTLEGLVSALQQLRLREAELATAHAALDAHAAGLEQRVASTTADARALAEERTRLLLRITTVLQNAPLVLLTLDAQGVITLAEGAGLSAAGAQRPGLVGRSAFEFMTRPVDRAVIRRALSGDAFSATVNPVTGTHYRMQFVPIRDDAGNLAGTTAVGIDESERQLAETQNILLLAAFQSGGDSVAIGTLADRKVAFVNPAWELLDRVARGDVVGRSVDEVGAHWPGTVLTEVLRAITNTSDFTADMTVRRGDAGQTRDVELRLEILRPERGPATHFVIVMRDITERKEHERELDHLAHYDTLTGLPNRLGFERAAGTTLGTMRAARTHASLILADLNGFQDVNDTFGHSVGDQLLRAIGPRLRAKLRPGDTLAHQGEDEFLIMLADADATVATAVTRDLIRALEEPHLLEGQRVEVSASFGIAVFPQDGDATNDLRRKADIALSIAKANDRGLFIYNAASDVHSPERLALVSELRDAIATGALIVHYQPLVDPRSSLPSAVEALVRWQHPVRGLVPPLDFIPTAERTGLIVPLTEYVLRTAVAQAMAWSRAGLPMTVSVNVSPRSFHDAELVPLVRAVLADAGLPPGSLTIEITEGSIMSHPVEALATMRQLREIGIHLSIDDFGTGYSSLAYLQRLPVTALKVDRSFVSAMRENSGSLAIVRSTIDLAHDLGLTVVAEGVEDAATLAELAQLKCDLAQGFHMCRPMPATDMTAWLSSRRVAAPR